jgi:hypothetical protein
MSAQDNLPPARLAPLVFAWLGLIGLTLFSLGLGSWLKAFSGLPTIVAAIVWLKAWLVAHYFLEAQLSRTFIRRLIWIFIAFAPIALMLTDTLGRQFADLMQL